MCLPGCMLMQQLIKPNKNVYSVTFSAFPGSHNIRIFNHIKVGLVINPVDGPISQRPGPIKMHQVTRFLWSYIRNYNRIHYQCSYTSPIP